MTQPPTQRIVTEAMLNALVADGSLGGAGGLSEQEIVTLVSQNQWLFATAEELGDLGETINQEIAGLGGPGLAVTNPGDLGGLLGEGKIGQWSIIYKGSQETIFAGVGGEPTLVGPDPDSGYPEDTIWTGPTGFYNLVATLTNGISGEVGYEAEARIRLANSYGGEVRFRGVVKPTESTPMKGLVFLTQGEAMTTLINTAPLGEEPSSTFAGVLPLVNNGTPEDDLLTINVYAIPLLLVTPNSGGSGGAVTLDVVRTLIANNTPEFAYVTDLGLINEQINDLINAGAGGGLGVDRVREIAIALAEPPIPNSIQILRLVNWQTSGSTFVVEFPAGNPLAPYSLQAFGDDGPEGFQTYLETSPYLQPGDIEVTRIYADTTVTFTQQWIDRLGSAIPAFAVDLLGMQHSGNPGDDMLAWRNAAPTTGPLASGAAVASLASQVAALGSGGGGGGGGGLSFEGKVLNGSGPITFDGTKPSGLVAVTLPPNDFVESTTFDGTLLGSPAGSGCLRAKKDVVVSLPFNVTVQGYNEIFFPNMYTTAEMMEMIGTLTIFALSTTDFTDPSLQIEQPVYFAPSVAQEGNGTITRFTFAPHTLALKKDWTYLLSFSLRLSNNTFDSAVASKMTGISGGGETVLMVLASSGEASPGA